MNGAEKAAIIHERLIKALMPESLEVIDESSQHQGHAGYGDGGRHFAVIIKSEALSKMTRVEAHRAIYSLLDDLIPEEIHALRIKL